MLDVHPPHEAAHSWKDFFIHIATIVIGLLIAIGLEQTVEWVHHRHEREALEVALQYDSELNARWCKQDLAVADGWRNWALQQAKTVDAAGSTGLLTVRMGPNGEIYFPNTGVWLAARTNGEVSRKRRLRAVSTARSPAFMLFVDMACCHVCEGHGWKPLN